VIADARGLARCCVALALACTHQRPSTPARTADAGIAIAVYDLADHAPYGVIDDRRWVELAGSVLVLEHVDPRAALPSLVIEALDDPHPSDHSFGHQRAALEVGACARDRIPGSAVAPAADSAPTAASAMGGASESSAPGAASGPLATAFVPLLRCAARGAPGRHLVRILYVVPALDYRASHDVAMTAPDRATVVSRFALATPVWQARAEVTLFDGMPGTQQPPREVARGPVMLDGGIAVLAARPRVVPAQLRRIYDGAVHRRSEVGARDPRWQRESHPAVWVWLELAGLTLAPGPVRAHVQLTGEPTRDIDVPALGRRKLANALALPLWVDEQLRGRRDRWSQSREDATLIDRFAVSIANLGEATREVWIEEALRPARRRTVSRAWPGAAAVLETVLRMKVTVPAGKIERGGFEVEYEL
jgi:hypothetical protein